LASVFLPTGGSYGSLCRPWQRQGIAGLARAHSRLTTGTGIIRRTARMRGVSASAAPRLSKTAVQRAARRTAYQSRVHAVGFRAQ